MSNHVIQQEFILIYNLHTVKCFLVSTIISCLCASVISIVFYKSYIFLVKKQITDFSTVYLLEITLSIMFYNKLVSLFTGLIYKHKYN